MKQLVSVCTFKTNSNLKHFYLQEFYQNAQLQIFVQANIAMENIHGNLFKQILPSKN